MSRALQTEFGGLTKARAHGRRARRAAFYRGESDATPARLLPRLLRLLCALVIAAVVATSAAFAYLYSHYSKVVDARMASGYVASRAGVYAAPRRLRAGQRMTAEGLSDILRRAGYVEGEASRVWNGAFKVGEGAIEIFPAETQDGAEAPAAVRVAFDRRGHISGLTGDGAPLESFALAPEPLTVEAGEKTSERAGLSYAEIPGTLRRAILSVEDRRFFEHGAVDLRGVARAAFSWGEDSLEPKQGGSTITQQLVKNTYLTPERTLRRKFREAALATVLESRMSKEDIFALYCNEIYLGQRGSIAVRGVRQAARVFFGKELKDLSLAESATIAGMIQSPGRYAPDRHAEAARARRNLALAAMLRDGAVTPEEARAACDEPVRVAPLERADAVAPYFIDYVGRAVESRLEQEPGQEGRSLRVYTTLDLDLQRAAEEAVARQVGRLEQTFKGRRRPQAALVALDPRTGHVLAMVGGASYAESQLNRATDARRQPGSVFKPVVYAAAMEAGLSPLTLSSDEPREFTYAGRSRYRPANYGGAFSMRDVTLRDGLVRSLNVVAVDAAMRTGLTRVAALAGRLGLPSPSPVYPSFALGAAEATPLEVATAYTAFASGGRVARPDPLLRVGDAAGDYGAREGADEQVLKPATAYMLTDMMTAVIDRGTARAARGAFKGTAVAGKTGTSRDGWFAGYTPNLVCVVWVGFDDNEELDLTGADAALPAWTEFVSRAVALRPELGGEEFARPTSVTFAEVDPETGLAAAPSCPRRERVALAPAFVPDHECSLHGDPWGLLALAASASQTAAHATNAQAEAPAAVSYETPASGAVYGPRDAHAAPAAPAGSRPASFADEGRATRVEVGRDGRSRLTNDLRVAPAGAGGWQE
ncbi:MAG TPA: PBP1A family penicillin-binding protein [Pyrinomonadaceae bacterium]|jgi:penicillin-binding protein 1B